MIFFNDINSFIEFVETRKRFSKKVSLENMYYFVSLFDHPEEKFKSIHVTGTNGKGSTVSYLKNIYLKNGYNVATFTSPYVIKFNERISYNNEYISDEDLLKYGNLILSKYDLIEQTGHELPGFFEFITLLAFLYFADLKVDIAIIEVGIGGRLDATNVITPIASVITSVGFDHLEQLGNTKELILNEKLGIVKNEVPLFTAVKEEALINQMITKCKLFQSDFIKVDFKRLKIKNIGLDSSEFSYKDFENLVIKLPGVHQIENSVLAIEVVNYLNKKSNLKVSCELLYEGLISTTWPGRLECVSNDPLIYIDGGHNIDCIKRVCEFVDTLSFNNKRVVISISSDKDKKSMIELLDNSFNELVFTKYTYKRSATSNELYELSNSLNKKIIQDMNQVIDYCFNNRSEFTLFIGSLYLISEIRPLLLNYQKKN
ncbi:MAG: bifunctional folylpolyglutamate synthase/dihydrofolate synthase [Bacilli bacterium]|nr:bifunctional folylpolyglutamate synthase/dihydrofolate synthase [Bacilli bacterium]